jgi:hypothetical protein
MKRTYRAGILERLQSSGKLVILAANWIASPQLYNSIRDRKTSF